MAKNDAWRRNGGDDSTPTRVLFVCLGNICRSPAAEAVMRKMADDEGLGSRFEIDSAGLYAGHAGQLPDPRMRSAAARRGLKLTHRARPVTAADFDDFDVIVAMDDSNYHALRRMAPTDSAEAKVVRMADFMTRHPAYDHVPDPYYEGAEGFELVLDMLDDGCSGLLRSLTHG